MLKRRKFPLWGLLVAVAIVIGSIGSYALAQSGSDSGSPAVPSDGPSRHVDYNFNLQVNGDLSAVNPKLQGLLPLNLSAQGGADVEKTANGPAVKGDVQLGGFDAIVQKLTAGDGTNGGSGALGSSLINSLLSNVQFVAVDKDIYVKLGGSWYDTGTMSGHKGEKPGGGGTSGNAAEKDKARAGLAGAFPDGPKALLKDVKTVGTEDIDGTATTHYSASIDVDKALTDAAAAARNSGNTDEAAKIDAAKGQITGAFKTFNVEWWMDGSNEVRQAKLAVDVNPSSLAPLVTQMAAGHAPKAGQTTDKPKIDPTAVLNGITSVSLNATVKFSHFNEDFQIAKPDGNIQPLKDLIGSFGGHKGGADNAGHKNKDRDSDSGGGDSGTATTTE